MKTFDIPLKSPEQVKGGEEARGIGKQPEACGNGGGAEGEDTKWVVGGLKMRVGWERCIGRGGQMGSLHSGVVQAGKVRGGRHTVGSCGTSRRSRDAAGRTAPGVKAA